MPGRKDVKPPLGLKPRHIHDQDRALDILAAMDRYVRFDYKVPIYWIKEFEYLVGVEPEATHE